MKNRLQYYNVTNLSSMPITLLHLISLGTNNPGANYNKADISGRLVGTDGYLYKLGDDFGDYGDYEFNKGGLASKKKKYSKGGTVKRNKKGLATKWI